MIQTTRRSLITGLISLVAAPAIVRATSIMPVRALDYEFLVEGPLRIPVMISVSSGEVTWRWGFKTIDDPGMVIRA